MRDLEKARLDATARVMKTLARTLRYETLPVKSEDGSSPLVVVLPEDSVEYLHHRLHSAGGNANVMVAYRDNLSLVAFREVTDGGSSIEDVAQVHQLSTVEMLVAWLRATPNGEGAIAVSDHKAEAASPVKELEYAF